MFDALSRFCVFVFKYIGKKKLCFFSLSLSLSQTILHFLVEVVAFAIFCFSGFLAVKPLLPWCVEEFCVVWFASHKCLEWDSTPVQNDLSSSLRHSCVIWELRGFFPNGHVWYDQRSIHASSFQLPPSTVIFKHTKTHIKPFQTRISERFLH